MTPPGNDKLVLIYINAQEFEEPPGPITYERVVDLAFPGQASDPNKLFTVSYRRGPSAKPQGTLVAGDSVDLKNKMIFDATSTTRS